jgi:hypothetical protein
VGFSCGYLPIQLLRYLLKGIDICTFHSHGSATLLNVLVELYLVRSEHLAAHVLHDRGALVISETVHLTKDVQVKTISLSFVSATIQNVTYC